jgi:hypothetical protein
MTTRLPILSPSHPASGIETSAPSAIAKSAKPSSALVSSAWRCTAGIRAAQEPTTSPSPKKNPVMARRVVRIRRALPRCRARRTVQPARSSESPR